MADKDFKVKSGLSLGTPLPVSMGGTGQTSTSNTLNALLPSQVGNSAKVLQTDGTNTSWISLPNGYSIGNTASRPGSPSLGQIYSNTQTGYIEVYTAAGWSQLGVIPLTPSTPTATDVGTNIAYGSGAIDVTFTPASGGGLASTFTATSTPSSITGSASSSPVRVTGLTLGTSYTFTIIATNGYGNATATSPSNSVTTTSVPQTPTIGTPTNVTGVSYGSTTSASVPVTANATGGKSISGFTITSSPGSLSATGTSPVTVAGLTSGTSYTFTAVATNANGNSTASSASSSLIPSTVPQAPTIGTPTQVTSSSVSVPFTANSNGNSAITSYTVTSSPGSITASGASSPLTVTGLTPGTAYTFTVTATNANGTSSASSASSSITPTIQYWSLGFNSAFPYSTGVNLSNGNGAMSPYASGRGMGYLEFNENGTVNSYKYITGTSSGGGQNSLITDSSGNKYFVHNESGISYRFNIIKLDSSNNVVWQKQHSSNYTSTGASMSCRNLKIGLDGSLYATGGRVTAFASGEPSLAYWVMKIDPSTGNTTWMKESITGGYNYAVTADSSGNVFIATQGSGIVKLNSSGTFVWRYLPSLISIGNYYATQIDVDSSGNIYTAGSTSSTYAAIAKLDTNGNLLWTRYISSFTNPSTPFDNGAITFKNNSLYVAANASQNNTTTGFILKFDASGNLSWSRSLIQANSGGGSWSVYDIDVDSNNSMYICGQMITGNPTYGNNGYVFKLPGDGTKTGNISLIGDKVITYGAGPSIASTTGTGPNSYSNSAWNNAGISTATPAFTFATGSDYAGDAGNRVLL